MPLRLHDDVVDFVREHASHGLPEQLIGAILAFTRQLRGDELPDLVAIDVRNGRMVPSEM